MRFSDLPRGCRAYVGAVCAIALLALGWALTTAAGAAVQLELVTLITLAAIVAHSFPVSTPGKQAYHVSLPFFVVAVVLLSPAELALAMVAVHVAEYWRKRRSAFAQVFNAAAYGLAGLAAYASFHALWPTTLHLGDPACLLAGVTAALVFTGLNRLLVSVAIWLGNGISPREQQMFALESLLTDGVLLLMGLPLAHLALIAPWAAAAGAAPLWLIHRVLDLPNVRAQRRQDGLTELFSAPYLSETCTRELHRARRFGRSTALVLLDVDGLGELNTTHGPSTGDSIIRGTAVVLRKATREYDLAARLAGGMFAVLLPETDLAQAQVVAERIRRSVADRRYEVPSSVEQARVTVSVGAVVAGAHAFTAEQLFAAAESALARAKAVGGNRSEFTELSPAEAEHTHPADDPATPGEAAAVPLTAKPMSGSFDVRRLRQVVAVAAAGAVSGMTLLSGRSAPDWALFAALLVLLIVLERRSADAAGRSGSALGLAPLAAGAMLLGPLGGVLLAIGVSVAGAAMHRANVKRVLIDGAAAVLVAACASLAFETAGLVALLLPPLGMRYFSRRSVERAVDSVRKLRTLNEQLEHRALHDPLTNLANRALFSERLEHAIRRAEDGSIAVLFLDLDNFKTVNDTLGHAAGDALLTIATQRLRQCVRWEDTIARLGGDEFTVLLENVRDVSQVVRSAERIAEALRQPFVIDGQTVQVSASIGIALDTDRTHLPDDLLREADLAMYRAKTAGKSRYEIFDPSMNSGVSEQLELEAELRQALAAGDLEVEYRRSGDGTLAVPRWRELHGAELVALADDFGLTAELQSWTLLAACRGAERISGSALSVGISLHDARLYETVERALQESGVRPERLRLRIGDGTVSIAKLAALSELGVQLSFGAGNTMAAVPAAA